MIEFGKFENIVELTDANFAQEVHGNSDEPSFWIVLFAADWVHIQTNFIVWSLSTSQTRVRDTRRTIERTRSEVGSCDRQES